MLLVVAPTADAGIHFVAAVSCMCPAASGTVVAAEVVVPPDMHCLPAVGAANAVVVDVVAIVAASDAGAAIFAVSVASVVAGAVAVGFATVTALPADAPSMPLVCPLQTCPSPYVLSLSTHFLHLFHQATFCAARACMHLRTCAPHVMSSSSLVASAEY